MKKRNGRKTGWSGLFVPSILFMVMISLTLEAGSLSDGITGSNVVASAMTGKIAVTWPDIVELVDRHPEIGEVKQTIAAAHAAVNSAGAISNPELTTTAGYAEAENTSTSKVEWGFELDIPLGWIAERGAKIGIADANVKVAEAEEMILRRDILLQLRNLFWNLLYAQERIIALSELSGQTNALAKIVTQRVAKGEVRPVEAVRVQVEVEKITGELEIESAGLTASQAKLAHWLGVDPERNLVVIGDLNKLPQPMTVKLARAKARTEHPEILAASARVQSLAAKVTLDRFSRVPFFSVKAFSDNELDHRSYGVGLTVDLPLLNWNSGKIQQSEREFAAGKKQLEAKHFELENIVLEAQVSCQSGVTLATRYKDRILPSAETALKSIERTYELGEATLLDVIDSRRTLLDIESQLLAVLVQAQIDCSRLDILAGEKLE